MHQVGPGRYKIGFQSLSEGTWCICEALKDRSETRILRSRSRLNRVAWPLNQVQVPPKSGRRLHILVGRGDEGRKKGRGGRSGGRGGQDLDPEFPKSSPRKLKIEPWPLPKLTRSRLHIFRDILGLIAIGAQISSLSRGQASTIAPSFRGVLSITRIIQHRHDKKNQSDKTMRNAYRVDCMLRRLTVTQPPSL